MNGRSTLLIQIVPGDARPINRQIVDAMRRLIASGELPVGAALPSVRGLAQQLTINPNTVAKAYNELTNDGWADVRPGLGLFVAAPRQRLAEEERERRIAEAVQRLVNEAIALQYQPAEVAARLDAEFTRSLTRNTP